MPSCPETLIPQVHTVPSDRSARSSSFEPAMATTPDSVPWPEGPTTETGSLLQTSRGPGGWPIEVGQ